MNKITLIILALGTFLCGCSTSQSYAAETDEDKGTAPVIVDSYAASVVRPGKTWNIYLIAKDNDGDMKDIFTVFMKGGNTPYHTTVTRIDNLNREELAGYLFLLVPVESDLLFRHFNFQVSISDDKGNISEPIVFPLRFDYVPTPNIPEGWEARANHPLGAILINLDGFIRSKYFRE